MTTAGRAVRTLAAGSAALLLAACTTTSSSPGSSTSSTRTADICGGQTLRTLHPGTLTVATFDPAYAPWFVGNEPGNGQGFESALAFRIGQLLGFDPRDVRWKRVPFGQIVGGGQKPFDLALAEVSITPQRTQVVDMSVSYAEVRHALLTYEGSPIDGGTTEAELRSARLGASEQTTSLAAIQQVIKPTTPAVSFPSIAKAGEALGAKQIDGVVADLPTAAFLANTVLDNGVLVGRLDRPAERIGAVLPKGSPLTSCVNQAIRKLQDNGTLGRLHDQWLPERDAVPVVPPPAQPSMPVPGSTESMTPAPAPTDAPSGSAPGDSSSHAPTGPAPSDAPAGSATAESAPS